MNASISRVVARYIQARAIPIDTHRIKELCNDWEDLIAKKTLGVKGPLGATTLINGTPYRIRAVNGEEITIYLALRSITDTRSPYYVVSGGKGKAGSKIVVIVDINGNTPAEEFNRAATKGGGLVARQLYPILVHEITHAADIFAKGFRNKTKEEVANDPKLYYNESSEVKAHLREIIEEINFSHFSKMEARFGAGQALKFLINLSKTWQEVSPHWTDKNKKSVIKSVAQALSEFQAGQD